MEDPGCLADYGPNVLDPYGMLDERWCAGKHLQLPHDGETSPRERLHVFRVGPPRVSRFGSDGRLSARGRGVVQVPGSVGLARAIGDDDDVVESEGERHVARCVVLGRITGLGPVRVRPEALIQVS